MNIPIVLRSALEDAFYFCNSMPFPSYLHYSGKSLVARYMDGRYFIPAICMQYSSFIGTPGIVGRDIVFPLVNPITIVKKTSNAIVKQLFSLPSWTNYNNSFHCIDTTKGYKYYGTRGLILTEDFKPLLLCGYEVRLGLGNYEYTHLVCFISPQVFTREDMVSKLIVKKVIPFYSGLDYNISGVDERGVRCNDSRVRIIISSEIDKFIHQPIAPMGADVDSEIYNILSSNLDILQTIE